MGTKWQKLKAEHDRLLRLMLIGSVAGIVVAYTSLIAVKVVWGLPDHDWWWIAFGPVVGFGFGFCAIWSASRRDLRDARRRDELE
jgi:hypothetical protein